MNARTRRAVEQEGRIQAEGYGSMPDPYAAVVNGLHEVIEPLIEREWVLTLEDAPAIFKEAAREWPKYVAAKRAAKRDTA